MMLDEHRTPRRFWAEVINNAYHVSSRIFLRVFLIKTSYELQDCHPRFAISGCLAIDALC
jgi:hypothetical protein